MGLLKKKIKEPKVEMPMATYCKWNDTLNTIVKMVQRYEKRLNCPTLTDVRPDLEIIQVANPDYVRWPGKALFDECGDKPDYLGRIASPFKGVSND